MGTIEQAAKTPDTSKLYASPATVDKMLASRKATSLLTSGHNMALLQSANVAQTGLFAKMGSNIVQGMKPGNITQPMLGLPANLVKQQNFMAPDKRTASREGARGPVKANQFLSGNKLVGSASKMVQRTISSPFEKRVADLNDRTAPIIPKPLNNLQLSAKKTAEGFFTGLRNHAKSRSDGKTMLRSGAKLLELKSKFLKAADEALLAQLAEEDADERYRYLLNHGIVHAVDVTTKSLYVELPQIEGILIVYRKPSERQKHPEVIDLSSRDLAHIPLLEGEEKLITLKLCDNRIGRVENLVSLPSLRNLNLKGN